MSTLPPSGADVNPQAPHNGKTNGDVNFCVSMPRTLLVAKDLNRGQREMVAYVRARCRGYGFCNKAKALADFVAHKTQPDTTSHMTMGTAKKYLRCIEKNLAASSPSKTKRAKSA